ncbi:MAG: hypothetical protein SNJ70_11670 [Armatimonadota bacterium]
MSATQQARESKRKDGKLISYPMAQAKIPKGALVCINADGYAVNAVDSANHTFAGVAFETVDNSAGANGDKNIRVFTSGTFEFVDGGGNCAQTDIGVAFKIVDNQTVTDASTTANITAGVAVERISSNKVRIRIDRFAS